MGNIKSYFQYEKQYSSQSNDEVFHIVQTAPKNSYAVKLKDNFPSLPKEIEQQRSKLTNNLIIRSISQSPIYYIHEFSAIYQGSWRNGLPHGEGRIIYSHNHQKSYYEGKIIDGELDTGDHQNQEALYIFSNGSYYIGGFKISKFQGKGKLVISNHMQITGQFKNGLPHGKCIQTFTQNDQKQVYEGLFVNGIKKGIGKYYHNDNLIYQGQFNEGAIHGQGQLYDDDGDIFKGIFNKGKKQQGELTMESGNIRQKFNGKFMQGQGIYQWDDGKLYIGQFKEQTFDGKGAIYFPEGSVVEGIWSDGHNLNIFKKYQISQQKKQKIKKKYTQDQQEPSIQEELQKINNQHQNQNESNLLLS